jgi:hypothetical protein
MKKLTRRQLAGTTAISAAALRALAQAPAAPAPAPIDKDARDSHRENSSELARFDIPMSLEPAFQFKA